MAYESSWVLEYLLNSLSTGLLYFLPASGHRLLLITRPIGLLVQWVASRDVSMGSGKVRGARCKEGIVRESV